MFDFVHADTPPRSRLLDQCFEDGSNARVFYLTVPERRFSGVNIALQKNGPDARFHSEIQMLRDENFSGVEKPVAFARKNIRIGAEGENLEGFTTLPVARVLRTEAGQYSLDEEFLPPVLTSHACPRLVVMVRGLLEVLTARCQQLSGVRTQRSTALAEFSVSDISRFWLLYTINTHFLVFQHLQREPGVHPETLYRQMLELAGSLTTFSLRISSADLPCYNHENPGRCFFSLEKILLELLDTAIPNRFVAFPLRKIRESTFGTEVDGDLLDKSRLYLAIDAQIPTEKLITRTPALVKVATETYLETLIRQALPGLPMTYIPSPPDEISIQLSYKYFSLDRAGAIWDAIKRARSFAVYVPGEIQDPRMELILVPIS